MDNAERMRKYRRKKKDESDLQKQESKLAQAQFQDEVQAFQVKFTIFQVE